MTSEDTHNLCVICLGEDHARSILEGAESSNSKRFSHRDLLGPILEGYGTSFYTPWCPIVAETETAENEVVEIAGRGIQERLSVTGSSDLLDQDVLSLEFSGPADSMLLVPSSQDEVDVGRTRILISLLSLPVVAGQFLAHNGHEASIPGRSA